MEITALVITVCVMLGVVLLILTVIAREATKPSTIEEPSGPSTVDPKAARPNETKPDDQKRQQEEEDRLVRAAACGEDPSQPVQTPKEAVCKSAVSVLGLLDAGAVVLWIIPAIGFIVGLGGAFGGGNPLGALAGAFWGNPFALGLDASCFALLVGRILALLAKKTFPRGAVIAGFVAGLLAMMRLAGQAIHPIEDGSRPPPVSQPLPTTAASPSRIPGLGFVERPLPGSRITGEQYLQLRGLVLSGIKKAVLNHSLTVRPTRFLMNFGVAGVWGTVYNKSDFHLDDVSLWIEFSEPETKGPRGKGGSEPLMKWLDEQFVYRILPNSTREFYFSLYTPENYGSVRVTIADVTSLEMDRYAFNTVDSLLRKHPSASFEEIKQVIDRGYPFE